MAHLYNTTELYIYPQFKLYHQSADSSTLFFKINSEELLQVRDLETDSFSMKFTIAYKLTASFESKDIIDSATHIYSDTLAAPKTGFIYDSFSIPTKTDNKYILKVTTTDNHRKKQHTTFINIHKTESLDQHHFLLFDTDTNMIFDRYFDSNRAVIVYYSGNATAHEIYLKTYHQSFPIATPPFHTTPPRAQNIRPDRLMKVPLKNGYTQPIVLDREGIFRFQADTTSRFGFTIFRFHEDYPAITIPEQMLLSARYLTTRREFEKMTLQADKMKAIEEFWINIGGSKERARQLIKNYYSRVRAANKFFTSYHEGWKTDRGMIYIVYGPPKTVYKSGHAEHWTYGGQSGIRGVNFTFHKVDNPITDNDFVLSKSELTRDSWHYAVSIWRR